MTTERELGIRLADDEAKKINKRFGVRSAAHIKVEAFAAAMGVKVIEGKLDGARARLKVGPEPIIRVSDRPCHPGDRSFSIGHEIGHYVLRHAAARVGALCKRERSLRPVHPGTARHPEAEANTVSAGVCMPSELLATPVAAATPSLDAAYSISAEYNMQLTAATIRFAELTPKRCAAVYSEAGKVLWAVRSPTFTAKLARGKRLDPASVAYSHLNGKLGDKPETLAADAWIAADAREEIVEHSTVVPETNGVITLLWIPESDSARRSRG